MTHLRVLLCVLALTGALGRAAEYPAPAGYVNDYVNMLTPDDRQALETRLRDYEQRTSVEIAVAIVTSLQGETVEQYANGLFKQWGIGKRGTNNGALFLWAPAERKVRIEVGYGLQSVLTDSAAAEIVNRVIGLFRRGEFTQGVNAAVDGIMAKLDARNAPEQARSGGPVSWGVLVGIIIGVVTLLIVLHRRRRMRRLTKEIPEKLLQCDTLLADAEKERAQAEIHLQKLQAEAPAEVWRGLAETLRDAPQRLAELRRQAAEIRSRPSQTYGDLGAVEHALKSWQHNVFEMGAGFGQVGAVYEAFRTCREESRNRLEPVGAALQQCASRYTAGDLSREAEKLLPAAQETYARARTEMNAQPPNWLRIHDLLTDVQDCVDRMQNPARWMRRARNWPGSDVDSPAADILALTFLNWGMQSSVGSDVGGISSGSDFGGFSGGGDSGGGGGFGGGDSGGGGASGDY